MHCEITHTLVFPAFIFVSLILLPIYFVRARLHFVCDSVFASAPQLSFSLLLSLLSSSSIRFVPSDRFSFQAMHVSLSTVLLLLWSLLLAPTIFGQNVNPNFLVTSSRNCLSNVDCPSTSFCGRFYFSSRYPGFKCIPRLRVNASCVSPSLAGECRPGLYCSSRGRVCRKQTPANSRCLPLDPMQCLGRLTCKSSTRRCGQPGAVGFKCTSDTDCRPAFYCARDRGRCVRREGPGTTCRPRFFRQCSGFCATSVANPSRGVCLPSRNDGGACTRTVQCLQADPASQKRGNFRVCNVARGYVGICLRETLQLKQLGVACSPKRDRCDADRGLACRWAGKKRGFVCQQRASVTDVGVTRFCTPKSPLSACLPIDGIPQECRRERENDFTTPYDGLYACLRETEFLPVGSICDHVEYALCASGTVCLPVPGISRKFLPRTPVKYCLIIRQLGEPCGGKFFSRCADGLKCVNGKCVKGTPTVGKVTHAYLNGDCTKLPCARGLVCAKPVAAPASSPLRICQFPVRIVDINRPCYDTARVRRVSCDLSSFNNILVNDSRLFFSNFYLANVSSDFNIHLHFSIFVFVA